MKTTFAAAIQLCGLSQQEAADFLGVRLDTVKSWSSGRNPPPAGVWAMLAQLWVQIESLAEKASDTMDVNSMTRTDLAEVVVNDSVDPLPGHSNTAAGALAVLLAFYNELDT